MRIGKEPLHGARAAAERDRRRRAQLVWEQMRTCYDPEIPINIVDLGLVYECEVERDADGERDRRR